MRLLAITGLIVVWLGLPMAANAEDQKVCPYGTVSAGSNAYDAHIECIKGAPAPGDYGPSEQIASQVHYGYDQLCPRGPGGHEQGTYFGCPGAVRCDPDGFMFHVTATYPDGREEEWNQCFQTTDIGPGISQTMIANAFKSVPLPESEMVVDPATGGIAVNMAAIYSTQAKEFVKDVELLGHTVTLKITPSTYSWTTGDGDAMRPTDWPGRRYDESVSPDDHPEAYVAHRYLQPGTYATNVDTTWTAQFKVDGKGEWEDVNDSVIMHGVAVNLPVVAEIAHLN
jgi:hypothetical protein